jgi:hypothetical protein
LDSHSPISQRVVLSAQRVALYLYSDLSQTRQEAEADIEVIASLF